MRVSHFYIADLSFQVNHNQIVPFFWTTPHNPKDLSRDRLVDSVVLPFVIAHREDRSNTRPFFDRVFSAWFLRWPEHTEKEVLVSKRVRISIPFNSND